MTKNEELKHAEDIFDALTDSYLMHYGLPGMEWYKNKAERYQPQAQYARFIPNPNGRVRGKEEITAAKDRMKVTHDDEWSDWSKEYIASYPKQKLSDFHKLNKKPNEEIRRGLNHPESEEYQAGREYNCPNCAMAFEMTERGYDVIARPAVDGSNVGDVERFIKNGKLHATGSFDTKKWESLDKEYFDLISKRNAAWRESKNAKGLMNAHRAKQALNQATKELEQKVKEFDDETFRLQKEAGSNTVKAIASQGASSRGVVVVGWLGDGAVRERTTSYHAFNYKNENGNVKFYDVQSRRPDKLNGFSMDDERNGFIMSVDPREIFIMRTDNAKITDKVTEAVYSPDRSKTLQHAESVFDALTESYLMHYGTPGMHWRQQGSGKRYQSQAVYAQGRPNPDGKVRGQKEKSEKVNVLSKKDFHNLSQSEQVRIHTAAAEGKNYDFTKKIRDSIQNEKDGSSGRVDSYIPARGPAQLNWEKKDGKVIFREPLFNRKVSDKYADNILNRSMFGEYSRGKTSSTERKNDELKHAESVFDTLTESYLMHYGVSGMEWYKNKAERYQPQAQYARFIPNPNGRVRGEKKKEDSSSRTVSGNPNADFNKKVRVASDAATLAISLLTLNPVGAAMSVKSIADSAMANKRTKANDERLANAEVDPESGLHLKKEACSEREDMKLINPGFKNYDDDTKKNCMNCTTAYEMRRRGFDVAANKRDVGYSAEKIKEYFPGAEHKVIQERDPSDRKSFMKASLGMNTAFGKKVLSELKQQPNGARGNLMLDWAEAGGHSVVYEVKNGNVIIRDCQTNKTYDSPNKALGQLLCYSVGASYIRTDNAKVDYKKIKEAVH